jgi:hypothetical protein
MLAKLRRAIFHQLNPQYQAFAPHIADDVVLLLQLFEPSKRCPA